ncbi:hypothetical protein TWF730_011128 [Orbilia blumenaviensis]|uniref:Uncharacterized protein n=1 Tax=Orbilia blumenaviensis TaxID=1796055 RepID=A0AAV9UJJ6_9PEZI
MAKGKSAAGGSGAGAACPPPPQQAVLSRLSFLYQASSLLSLPQSASSSSSPSQSSPSLPSQSSPPSVSSSPTPSIGLSRYYTSHLLAVSKKSVQRISPPLKRSICKRCLSPLLPGITSTTRVENKSKKGRVRHADVVVITCGFCAATKRFPAFDKEDMKRIKKEKEEKKPRSDASIRKREKGADREDGDVAAVETDVAMTGT